MAIAPVCTKPTVAFVPGAWHDSEGFNDLRAQLQKLDYPTEAVNHPSIGGEDRSKSTVDDVANVQQLLTKLVTEGKDVVVVCHSYGGVVASNAVEGFGAIERATGGKKGGVISLIYMTAFVLPKNATLLGALGGVPLPWMDVQVSKFQRPSHVSLLHTYRTVSFDMQYRVKPPTPDNLQISSTTI